MLAAWMLTAVLAAPPRGLAPAKPNGATGLSAADLKVEHGLLMQRTARRAQPDPQQAVPELVAFRGRITAAELHPLDRHRLLCATDRRLIELHSRLRERIARAARESSSTARRASARDEATAPDPVQPELAGGAGVPATALELIQLIETTVVPESWASNGGPGTITYWRPGMALVIRQTGEVHHQIGGTLGQLRRLQP